MNEPKELIVGESLSSCPLNDAISNTAFAAHDADGLTLLILQNHLKELCRLQIIELSTEEFNG